MRFTVLRYWFLHDWLCCRIICYTRICLWYNSLWGVSLETRATPLFPGNEAGGGGGDVDASIIIMTHNLMIVVEN